MSRELILIIWAFFITIIEVIVFVFLYPNLSNSIYYLVGETLRFGPIIVYILWRDWPFHKKEPNE